MKRDTPPDVGSAYRVFKGHFIRAGFMTLSKKAGFRFDRRDDMDLWESPEPEFRDNALREAVDLLPDDERLVISRLFFGADSPSPNMLAREMGISLDKVKGMRDRGLERIRDLFGPQ